VVLPPDTTKPVITLNGENPMELIQGTAYSEAGATATDDRDGTITVTTSGTVNINTLGSYTITYKAVDSAGNEAVATRTVDVVLPISKISGYVEDDPIPNASIKITNELGEVIVETTSDVNAKYELEAPFEEGKTYTLESKGQLGDRNITLHSIFKFSEDTVINANPLTELKYQLVQSGKSIEDAEALIRDYFSVVNGEKLERNRFDIEGSVALGMIDLAKLYNGTLPVDAILKIKEDILRNDALDDNETKEYSYRTLVQNEIELETSSTSLKLGEEVTVTVVGFSELNENYTLKWSGIPEDAIDSNNSKTFTMTDNAQDLYVKASLYKVDGNVSQFISSADTTINFYKELIENNLTVADASIDNNFTIGESSISVPAGTVSDGNIIRVRELQTGSETSIAQFEVDAGGATSGDITFNYKYDPYLVAEPRNLQISLRSGDEVKVLEVIDIDYTEHLVQFGIPLNNSINRSDLNNLSASISIVNTTSTLPINKNIDVFLKDYKKYIEKIIDNSVAKKSVVLATKMKTKLFTTDLLEGEDLTRAKFYKVLKEKDVTSGDYKFNVLARAVNNIIAYEKAQELFNSSASWEISRLSLEYLNQKLCYNSMAAQFYDSSHWTYGSECSSSRKSMTDKMVDVNLLLANWLGNITLNESQQNFLKFSKTVTNMAVSVATGATPYEFALALEGEAFAYIDEDTYGGDEFGYAYGASMDLLNSIKDGKNAFSLKGQLIGYGVDQFFKFVAEGIKESNAKKTAPIILQLYKYRDELNYKNSANEVFSQPYCLNEFLDTFYPNITSGHYENYYRQWFNGNTYSPIDSIGERKNFGEDLDPGNRLRKLLLVGFPTDEAWCIGGSLYGDGKNLANISDETRGYAFTLLKYAFGDSNAGSDFADLELKKSYALGSMILNTIYFIPNNSVTEFKGEESFDINTLSTITTFKRRIKTEYTLTSLESIQNFFRSNSNTSSIHDIKSVNSFLEIMEKAKLKVTSEQLEKLNFKKIKIETYGIALDYSEDDNAWTLDRSDTEDTNYTVTENINDKFIYDSELEKNVLSFATLFEGEDFTPFDNKLVGFKVTLVYEKNGIEKVRSKDFIFTTLADTEHLVETDFTGATLKSSAKDASTGSPIENAQVTLVPGGLTDFTDAEGNYEVSGVAAGDYTIVISKEGYSQVEAQLTLVEDETKVYEASLAIDDEHAVSLGGANITLKDALNGDVVTNGYVKVREGQNNKTGEVVQEILNDGNSSVNIEMYPNTYTVEVGANGYTKSYNTVTILGDINGTYEFSITPVLSEDQVRVVLTWGESPHDLDSHLVRKTDGNEDYHVAYYNMNPSNADANLDTDDTDSFGPETITINNLSNASTYKYYVHDYSNGSNHDDEMFKTSGAKIEVYYGDQSETFYVPNENGNAWKVFEIVNGQIEACTSGCMFGVDSSEDANIGLRSLDRSSLDKSYFKNLPEK